ncbi:MAG: hypothetical protein L0287_31435 [Anaerolineae bacterium]|nr:hypothetical protein [Anaerolineae bacterium]
MIEQLTGQHEFDISLKRWRLAFELGDVIVKIPEELRYGRDMSLKSLADLPAYSCAMPL